MIVLLCLLLWAASGPSAQACSANFTGLTGTFQSPNFPSYHGNDLNCTYLISVPNGYHIFLNFTYIDLQNSSTCASEYIEVRDGGNQTAQLLRRLCAERVPLVQRSSGSRLWVRFSSGSSGSRTGFSATYTAECGGILTALSGTIQSPNFPNEHANNLNCTYIIRAPEGHRVTLNVTHLDLELGQTYSSRQPASPCPYDYLEIREGGEESGPSLGRYCDGMVPLVRRSFGRQLYLRFFTDSSVTATGFQATYTSEEMDDNFFLIVSNGVSSSSSYSYYSSSGPSSILRVDPATSSHYRLPLAAGRYSPRAVDYDPVEGRVYWTQSNATSLAILSASLSARDVRVVYSTTRRYTSGPSTQPGLLGMAVDPVSRLIFYTSYRSKEIAMLTMSTHLPRTVVAVNVSSPRDIVLDTRDGVLFWTDWGTSTSYRSNSGKIERASYDGSGRKVLVDRNLDHPNGLALDLANSKLYWVNSGLDRVESSDLEGKGRAVVFRGSSYYNPYSSSYSSYSSRVLLGLALHGGSLFVTDWGPRRTYSSSGSMSYLLELGLSANQTNATRVFSNDEKLNDIHFYHERNTANGVNGCGSNNGGCSQICIPLPSNRSKCACPNQYRKSPSGTECVACDEHLTALSGAFHWPTSPDDRTRHMNCTYVITAPHGYRVTVHFASLDLHQKYFYDYRCRHDFVEIRDGGTESGPLLGRYCGETGPLMQRSFGRSLWLRLSTISGLVDGGFNATYVSEEAEDEFLLMTCSRPRTTTNYNSAILRMDPRTTSNYQVNISSTLYFPMALSYDPAYHRLYWTESGQIVNRIRSSHLNGTDVRTDFTANAVAQLDGLAVDPLSRLIFYTDAGNQLVAVLTMSSHEQRLVASSGLERPRAVVLQPATGVVFWTDCGSKPKIERASYDGSDRRTVVGKSKYHVNVFNGLAIDLQNSKLYWVDAESDKIESSDLEGRGREVVFQGATSDPSSYLPFSPTRHFFGLALADNTLYITDWRSPSSYYSSSYLWQLPLGQNVTNMTRIFTYSTRLNDIHTYRDTLPANGPNGCGNNNGGCRVFCIPLPSNRSKCACPDGQVLSPDRVSCGAEPVSIPSPVPQTTPSPTTSTTSDPHTIYTLVRSSQPLPFVTDGSGELTLTCELNHKGSVTVLGFTWSVPCVREAGSTCVLRPGVAEDGSVVQCTAQLEDGRRSHPVSFYIHLNYPPPGGPVITGYNAGQVLQAGEGLTLICSVSGGKPLVTSVSLHCAGHPASATHVRRAREVLSVLSVGPVSSQDDGRDCVCQATWTVSDYYRLNDTITLRVNGTYAPEHGKVTADKASLAGPIAGAVLAVVVVVVLVVIIVLVIRKKRQGAYEDQTAVLSQQAAADPASGGHGHAGISMFHSSDDRMTTA